MSVLRLLSPQRGQTTPPSLRSANGPTLALDVPAYGGIVMDAPPDPSIPQDLQTLSMSSKVLRGMLIVTLPASFGRKRVKRITVGVRSLSKLDLGVGRRGEEDVLFERKVELVDGSSSSSSSSSPATSLPCSSSELWLEPGTQSFDFVFIIPENLAPHDWHANGTIRHMLYAEIQGRVTAAGPFSHLVSRSTSPYAARSRGNRSTSRSPGPSTTFVPLGSTPPPSLLPPAPSYAESETGPEHWLQGEYRTERALMIIYDPNRDGQVSSLQISIHGVLDGVGVWSLAADAHPWSISSVLHSQLRLESISPRATIFSIRVILDQTHSILSPRDDPDVAQPITSTRRFVLADKGKPLPKEYEYPRSEWPALYRGTDAGGDDTGPFVCEMDGRLPKDDVGRPSTLPGVVTPIKVSHTLQYDVLFSVWGEELDGSPIPGAGAARMMTVKQDVIVPSCAFIHQMVDLPSYDESQSTSTDGEINTPCPLCKVRPSERLCTQCPPNYPAHVRHDHDPKLVGDPTGRCSLCSHGALMPTSKLPWKDCACGLSIAQMDVRMRGQQENAVGMGALDVSATGKGEKARGRRR